MFYERWDGGCCTTRDLSTLHRLGSGWGWAPAARLCPVSWLGGKDERVIGAMTTRGVLQTTTMHVPTPSALFSNAHTLYDRLSTSITNMAAPLDHEEELWPEFEVSMQSVTDAFKKYAEFEIPSNSFMRLTTRPY